MNTKKILIYGGGALVLGAVGFFIWSFFQKVDVPLAQTNSSLAEDNKSSQDETPTNSGSNPFTSMLNNTFQPIKTPNLGSDLDMMMTDS